jgi:hypothetical protein
MAVVPETADQDGTGCSAAQYHHGWCGPNNVFRRKDQLTGSQEETEITVYAGGSVTQSDGRVRLASGSGFEDDRWTIEIRTGSGGRRDGGGGRPAFQIEKRARCGRREDVHVTDFGSSSSWCL